MRKHVIWIILSVLVIIYMVSAVVISQKSGKPIIAKRIALINITGEIDNVTDTLRQINTFADMRSVEAIVLRINSPGGWPAASQEVYRLIQRVRERGVKVVVSMGDLAASGAYYIAAAADKIYANPATLTGSIGVYMSFMNAEKLLGKLGLDYVTVKSGKYKDTGSFARPPTKKEIAVLKELMVDVHSQFLSDVANSRFRQIAEANGIESEDEEKMKLLALARLTSFTSDGRVFTGRAAKENGLIDELGSIDDAIEGAAKMAGIPGRPKVITEKRKESLSVLLRSTLNSFKLNEKSGFAIKYLLHK